MSPHVLIADVLNRYTTVARLSYCMDICIEYLYMVKQKTKKNKNLAFSLWNFPIGVHSYFGVTLLDKPYFTNGLFATLSASVVNPDPNMFLGFLDPEPDPLVRGMDPDPSIIKQK